MATKKIKNIDGTTSYKVTIWDKGRYVCSKSFKRRVDASEWENKQKARLADNQVGRPRGNTTSLNEFFEEVYLPNTRVRESTRREYLSSYDSHIRSSLGQSNMNDLTTADWIRFKSEILSKGLTPARANRIHTVASAIYKIAVQMGYSQSNPLSGIGFYSESLKSIEHWSRDEAKTFLEWCLEDGTTLYPYYLTSYLTGLRFSELVALQWDCVDFEQEVIEVRRSLCKGTNSIIETTKSGKTRMIGMNSTLKSVLQKLKLNSPGKLVFSHEDGRKFRYEYLRKWFFKHQKEAGVRRVGIHGIRHSFASHFVMGGGNVYELKELLGHADISTTMRYAHLAKDHLKAQAQVVTFTPKSGAKVIPLPKTS